MPVIRRNFRFWRLVRAHGTGLLLFAGGLTASLPATAEELISIDNRARLFAELARDVEHLEQQGNILKRTVKLVTPSVVHIEAKRDDDARNLNKTVEEAGSGVVIERAGKHFVITNRHVIKYSSLASIKIKLSDGRLLAPTQVWADRETDIAILAVPGKNLIPANIGDSDKLEIGDFVLAVGSPFGLSHSVTYGIISAKGRRDLQLGDDGVTNQDFLQTDAAINPGNSGGPLLNLRGEVVGINTAIASSSGGNEGIGFTIPVNMVMVVADQLIDHGQVVRAYLGVQLDATFTREEAIAAGLQRPEGARITGVTPRSPAEMARLQPGDVILNFNGYRVEDDDHLINLVSLTPVDKEVELTLMRDTQTVRLRVRVGNRSDLKPALETSRNE
ncbi:Periplasmic serine endoprotease DegP precursor [Anatilimnocola aggregata]|uniref:Periplasmic serine endoprotease DegP n=1 Tax=Anatilimnocola aggregata TaxID=2528021 RepID=A0A517YID5_9BACT|nr:trypsin-like peptidase domain-containing protein [Anatilimnocola aggregata]QDU29993.1 Periplasmic serine endoprotease DegP precursor [Anatilimnocola aggregata]